MTGKQQTNPFAVCCIGILTRVFLNEGVNVDASSRAPCVEHHPVEDAAGVGRPAEAGEDAPNAGGEIQQRDLCLGLGLGLSQLRHSEQDQQAGNRRHLLSG